MLYVSGKTELGYEVTDTKDGVVTSYTAEQIATLSTKVFIGGVQNGKVERVYTFKEYAEELAFLRLKALGVKYPSTMKVEYDVKDEFGNILVKCSDESAYLALPNGIDSVRANLFKGKNNLKRVYIPKSLQQICANAFEGSGLTEVELNESLLGVQYGAFSDCSCLREVKFPMVIDAFLEIKPFSFANTPVESLIFPEYGQEVELAFSAFHKCENLRRVVLPRCVCGIHELRPAHPFMGCTNLEYVFLPSRVAGYTEDAKNYWNRFKHNPDEAYKSDIVSRMAGDKISFEEYLEYAYNRPTYVILPNMRERFERLKIIPELKIEVLPDSIVYKGERVYTDTLYKQEAKGVRDPRYYTKYELTTDEFLRLFGL